jgi:hypothetical protein
VHGGSRWRQKGSSPFAARISVFRFLGKEPFHGFNII